jgi:hypothetical protein
MQGEIVKVRHEAPEAPSIPIPISIPLPKCFKSGDFREKRMANQFLVTGE